MRIETISAIVVAVVAVISLLMNMHDKHPHLLKEILMSLFNGIPFGFIPHHLPTAIILFVLTRIIDIYKNAHKPNLCLVDVYWTMASLCLHSGIFAVFVVFIHSK